MTRGTLLAALLGFAVAFGLGWGLARTAGTGEPHPEDRSPSRGPGEEPGLRGAAPAASAPAARTVPLSHLRAIEEHRPRLREEVLARWAASMAPMLPTGAAAPRERADAWTRVVREDESKQAGGALGLALATSSLPPEELAGRYLAAQNDDERRAIATGLAMALAPDLEKYFALTREMDDEEKRVELFVALPGAMTNVATLRMLIDATSIEWLRRGVAESDRPIAPMSADEMGGILSALAARIERGEDTCALLQVTRRVLVARARGSDARAVRRTFMQRLRAGTESLRRSIHVCLQADPALARALPELRD